MNQSGDRGLSRIQRLYRTEGAHRVLPWPLAATMMTTWARLVWHRDPRIRSDALRHMRFLLGPEASEGSVEAAARAYLVENYLRIERWHRPWQTTGHPPEGIETLRATLASGRGAIVNFLHYGETHGPLGALARAGIPLSTAVNAGLLRPDRDSLQRQIIRTLTAGGAGQVFDAKGASEHIRTLLRSGSVVALASDIPSNSFVTLLGRDVGISLGAARLAHECNAPVFPLVATRVGRNPTWRLDPPIEPTEHEDPLSLLQEMMRRQEPTLRRWPEALDRPLRRWTPEPDVVRATGWSLDEPLAI